MGKSVRVGWAFVTVALHKLNKVCMHACVCVSVRAYVGVYVFVCVCVCAGVCGCMCVRSCVRNDRRSAHPSHYSQDGWCSRPVRPRCCCLEAPLYILEGSLSRPLRSISLRCQTHLFQLS